MAYLHLADHIAPHAIRESSKIALDALRSPQTAADNAGMNQSEEMRESLGSVLRGLRTAQSKRQPEVADPIGYDAGNLSRVERGRQNIAPDVLERLCQQLGVRVSEVYQLAERVRSGEKVDFAAYLQQRSSAAAVEDKTNISPAPDFQGLVPQISWVQAGNWTEIVDNFAPGDAEDWLLCPAKHGPHAFALRVEGKSMYNPDGDKSFDHGDIIFVDPDRPYNNGSMVVVRLDNEVKATFKRLHIDGDRTYLEALNPDWPNRIVEVTGPATICGVVFGKWVPL